MRRFYSGTVCYNSVEPLKGCMKRTDKGNTGTLGQPLPVALLGWAVIQGLASTSSVAKNEHLPESGMKPTAYLRWREATPSEELRRPCITLARSWNHERFVLEQLWRDDSGRSEWKLVEHHRVEGQTGESNSQRGKENAAPRDWHGAA